MTKAKGKPEAEGAPVKRSLFDISADLLELERLLLESGGELPGDAGDEALERFFDTLGAERDLKLDNYAALIKQLRAEGEARKQEAKRLTELARTGNNAADRLEARLQTFFEVQRIEKLKTRRYNFTLANNGGVRPLRYQVGFKAENLPEHLRLVEIKPNTDALREALEEGEQVAGVYLDERGRSLRIR